MMRILIRRAAQDKGVWTENGDGQSEEEDGE